MRLGDGWAGLKIPMGFSRKSAVLAEIFAVLAENSKRRVIFCTLNARFYDKVSARRAEDEAKLVSAAHPELKRHLDLFKVSAKRAQGES